MSDKIFYRAIKDSFLWKAGAVLEKDPSQGSVGGYSPVNGLGIWDTTVYNGSEYISADVIENNPDWFERVYPVDEKTGKIEFENADGTAERYKWKYKSN